jgi:hypothetical protein
MIVLDANTIIRDYRLEGTAFRALLDSARSVGEPLCVPRCALDEVQEHFEQALRGAMSQLTNAARSVGRLLQKDFATPALDDFPAQAALYRAWFETRIEEAGGMILDYPSFSGEEVVQRAAKHKKPFAAKGDEGLKDYLIWKGVVVLAKDSKTAIKLVTTNSSDFGDGHGGLHSDLLGDLDAAGIPHDRIIIRESVDAVLTGFVMPALQEVKEIEEQLAQGTFRGLNLEQWADENLIEGIDLGKVDDLRWVMTWEWQHLEVLGLSGVSALDVSNVRRLPSQEMLIEIEADIEVEVGYSYPDMEQMSERDWVQVDRHGTAHLRMFLTLLLTFDPDEQEVTSWDVAHASARSATRQGGDYLT